MPGSAIVYFSHLKAAVTLYMCIQHTSRVCIYVYIHIYIYVYIHGARQTFNTRNKMMKVKGVQSLLFFYDKFVIRKRKIAS